MTLSHDTNLGRAVRRSRYGDAEVLEVFGAEPAPAAEAGEVVVAVEAAALNPLDWHQMTGRPWVMRIGGGLRRPREAALGHDFAGRVVAVGSGVDGFEVGDEVIGSAPGALASLVACPADQLVHKPSAVRSVEAAGLPIAGVTALQGLRDHGGVKRGQKVLINGASGGVGTMAIQIAKWLGAEVTAVCSARNSELVRSLGADHVVDYATQDFTETDERYHVLLDNQGNQPLRRCRRILVEGGTYVVVGGPKSNPMFGPMGRMLGAMVTFQFASQQARPFIANMNTDDLGVLTGLMASGHLCVVVGAQHDLDDIDGAMRVLASGHARGKVIVIP